MTLQTRTAAAAANGRAKPLLANTAIFWSVMTTVVALTLMLTGWTAVQAQAVEDTINGNGPAYPSIRQLERQAEEKGTTTDHLSIRQAERQAAMTAPQPPPLTVRQGERRRSSGTSGWRSSRPQSTSASPTALPSPSRSSSPA